MSQLILTKAKALQQAEKLRHLSIEINNLTQVKKGVEEELRAFVAETGEKDLGAVLAYERAKPAKLSGAEGKRLEMMQEEIMNTFPDYTKRSLNVTDMAKNIEIDTVLQDFLEQIGLGIEQEVEIYFKSK
jgi:hypothetical protein